MKEYDFRIANSITILGKSSRIEPTLKNQFLQVSFATSTDKVSLLKEQNYILTFNYITTIYLALQVTKSGLYAILTFVYL